ncbi:hypothetical protein ACFFGV_18385 [Pontibacillus salicampi]|uniref:Uncharacterized protein n=1 Tax=Pontibacillus salicampi TaxID=1449801 RepID=A0ABV6LT15_9BACI
MNLEKLMKENATFSKKSVTSIELVNLIQKRLLYVNEHYIWYSLNDLGKMQELYLRTLPYLLFLGYKHKMQPWTVKSPLLNSFEKDISEEIYKLNVEVSTFPYVERQQKAFETIINQYCMLGLNLGLTPKHIQNMYLQEKHRLCEPFETDMMTSYIQKTYIEQSIKEEMLV